MSSAIAPPIYVPNDQDVTETRETLSHLEHDNVHPALAAKPRQGSMGALLAFSALGALLSAVTTQRRAPRRSWLALLMKPSKRSYRGAGAPALLGLSAASTGFLPFPLLAAGAARLARRFVAKRNAGLLARLFAR